MRKILYIILTILALTVILTGCAKCINTENSTVQVKVTDEYHRGAYVTPLIVGKVRTVTTHPAVYRITVEYDGTEYNISGSDTYYKYSDKIGEYANGTLETQKYDDGTVKYNIICLE